MARAAEQVGASSSEGALVPAGGLWRLILRAWCGSSLEGVCARIGRHCDLAPTQIEATVLGLMNDSITALPFGVAEAFEAAFGPQSEAGIERREDDMTKNLNGRATITPASVVATPPIGEPTLDEDLDARLPGEAQAGPEPTGRLRRRGWPFPCEEESCDRGFETAQGLRMHHLRGHEHKGGNGRGRKPSRTPDALNERHVKILTAAERSEDPETEAVAVCSRHLTRLAEPEAKRVLEYLAQRFVVDAS